MFKRIAVPYVALALLSGSAIAEDASPDLMTEVQQLPWQTNTVGQMASVASVGIPSGYQFLGSAGASRFIQLNRNPPPAVESYVFSRSDFGWFAVFAFDPSGYVADNETIDAPALLATLKEQNQTAQEERQKLNLPSLTLEDWSVPPHYDQQTNRLEWGTRLRQADGGTTVNYTIKLLGRTGVMNALLVTSPETLTKDVTEFKSVLKRFSFASGERYAEYRNGDKVAEYGLTALIVGGAAAVAAKSGVFKVLAKFIGIGAIALFAAIAGFFRRLFGKKRTVT